MNDEFKIEYWPKPQTTGMLTGTIETGIKVTHLPTGKSSECTLYRSQHQNKEEAMKLLKERLDND